MRGDNLHLLPTPEMVRCFFETQFQPSLPAMELRWDPNTPGIAERVWTFPKQMTMKGPPPRLFGVTLTREGNDCYQVRLLWNELCLTWRALKRTEILASSLAPVLRALGTDLWYLLNQPVEGKAAA